MQGNRVATTAVMKSDESQGLKLVPVVSESFTQLSSRNQEEVSIEPLNKITDSIVGVSETETLPDISDPWTLPIGEDITATTPNHHNTQQQKPLLLLPPATSVVTDKHDGSISSSSKLDELLTKVN